MTVKTKSKAGRPKLEKPKNVQINSRVAEDMYARAQALAVRWNIPVGTISRLAIEHFVDEFEDTKAPWSP